MAKEKIDLGKVQEYYDKARRASQAERYTYERDWFRNVLFLLGIQWIIFSPVSRKWRPRKMDKWVPRPVTNKFASVATTIMQVLTAKEPEVRARPGSNSPEDTAAAGVADRNFDVIMQEAGADEARQQAAPWLVLTGNAWFLSQIDNDPQHGTTFVRHLKCAKCGKVFAPDEAGPGVPAFAPAVSTDLKPAPGGGSGTGKPPMPLPVGSEPAIPAETQESEASCPQCGHPVLNEASDEEGNEIGEELPNGKNKLEVFSPFEVFGDMEARSADELPMLLARRRYPVDLIRRKFNHPELEADNNSNVGGIIGLNLLRAIAYATGSAMYGTGVASGRSLGDDQSITVDQLWIKPCTDFPEGCVAIYANEKLLNSDAIGDGLPYRNRDGTPRWTWRHVVFDKVPGRLFGRTPMDDVAPKQEQRNKLESLIQLMVTRTANAVWLIAKGIGITEITGEPGQILEGNWGMDPKLKPERVSGENVPTSLIAWLEKIDKDIEELSGTFEVLRGNAPPGVTAGTALRLLLERANTRFTPVIRRYEKVWEQVCGDQLAIFQQFGTEERINKIQGPGKTWEVQRFTKADLNGDVDIIVEAGSAAPKSLVGEQATIQDLTTGGVVDPQNPETQYKILERFGETSLLGDADLNIQYAQRENWKFINEGKVPVLNPILDNNAVHITVHKQYALTSDFELLPPETQKEFLGHIIQHQMAMASPTMPVAPGAEGEAPQPGGPPGAAPVGGKERQAGMPPQQTPTDTGTPPLFPGA